MNTRGDEKEGWLIKNGEKRYVYLTGGLIKWSLEPFGKVKNVLSVKDFQAKDVGDEEKVITLVPLKGDGKQYVLECATSQEAHQWRNALKSWDLGKCFPLQQQQISISSSSTSRSRGHTDPAVAQLRRESSASDFLLQLNRGGGEDLARFKGWLLKKMKKRFFIIHRRVLYWSALELAHPNTSEQEKEFLKTVNGSLPLLGLSVEPVDDLSFEIVSNSGSHYLLTSSLTTECTNWIKAIRYSLAVQGQLDVQSLPVSEHRGWLHLYGSGRRFVLLRRCLLLWYATDHDSNPKGMVSVARILLERASGDPNNQFSVIQDDGRVHRFRGSDAADVDAWTKSIETAVAAASSDAVAASLAGRAGTDATSGGPRRRGAGRDHRRTFYQQAHKNAWIDYGKTGKRRFLVLRNNKVLGFDKEAGSDNPALAKFSFTVQGCTLSRDTSTPLLARTVLVNRKAGSAAESDEEHRFTFVDAAVAAEWELALQLAVDRSRGAVAASSLSSSSSSSSQSPAAGVAAAAAATAATVAAADSMEPVCTGLMMKKGKQRWFQLYSHGILDWRLNKDEADARNHCLLVGSSVQQVGASTIISVVLETGKKYELLCATPAEAKRWLLNLQTIVKQTTDSLHPYKVFGKPLSAETVTVVEDTVAVLRQVGPVLGLFRESGDQREIFMLRDAYDQGLRPALSPDMPHEIAGLLKLYVRTLPEPVVPFQFARQILDASSGQEMVALVQQFPAANQQVVKVLFDFLTDFSRDHGDVTRMTLKNLALSFGTSLLRPDGDEITILSETNNIANSLTAMLEAWDANRQQEQPRPRASVPPGKKVNAQLLNKIAQDLQTDETLLEALNRHIVTARKHNDQQTLSDLLAILSLDD